MDELGAALEAAGGLAAGPETAARLRTLLAEELSAARPSSSASARATTRPVTVAVAPGAGRAARRRPRRRPRSRADPRRRRRARVAARRRARRRARRGRRAPARVQAGAIGDNLVLEVPGDPADAELVPLAFDGQVAGLDRLRARALAVPAFVLDDVGRPQGADRRRAPARASPRRSPRSAAARPTRASVAEHEEAVLALLDAAADGGVARPHDDPDPARRVARRILQRLNGMGKWGGYHTEFAHLARGFAGNDRNARRGRRRGAARGRPARREAERRPAPRVPQPAPRRGHPRADRARRRPRRTSPCRERTRFPSP